MEAGARPDQNETIRLGMAMPRFLRVGLTAVGLFACIMVVKELGPGLWPLSIFSLFFGIIIFGGLSVGLAFVVIGWLAPDEIWDISPGQLTLVLMRGPHRLERHFTPADFEELTVVRDDSGDGAATWHISGRISLNSPNLIMWPEREPALIVLGWLRGLGAPLSLLRPAPPYQDYLRSPALTTEVAARKALDHFRTL